MFQSNAPQGTVERTQAELYNLAYLMGKMDSTLDKLLKEVKKIKEVEEAGVKDDSK
jgi:hypothetical protein